MRPLVLYDMEQRSFLLGKFEPFEVLFVSALVFRVEQRIRSLVELVQIIMMRFHNHCIGQGDSIYAYV